MNNSEIQVIKTLSEIIEENPIIKNTSSQIESIIEPNIELWSIYYFDEPEISNDCYIFTNTETWAKFILSKDEYIEYVKLTTTNMDKEDMLWFLRKIFSIMNEKNQLKDEKDKEMEEIMNKPEVKNLSEEWLKIFLSNLKDWKLYEKALSKAINEEKKIKNNNEYLEIIEAKKKNCSETIKKIIEQLGNINPIIILNYIENVEKLPNELMIIVHEYLVKNKGKKDINEALEQAEAMEEINKLIEFKEIIWELFQKLYSPIYVLAEIKAMIEINQTFSEELKTEFYDFKWKNSFSACLKIFKKNKNLI